MGALAERYEARFPGATSDEAQKEERMQRLDFKHEARALRRTMRNRGIVVPRLPVDSEGRLLP